MKKLVLFFAIASVIAFSACTNKTKETATPEAEATEQTATAPEGDLLAKYEAFVDKTISLGLMEKVAAGDQAAATEWTKLLQEYATVAQELQDEVSKFTPEELQKFTAISQKWADYAQKAVGQ